MDNTKRVCYCSNTRSSQTFSLSSHNECLLWEFYMKPALSTEHRVTGFIGGDTYGYH
jgi:hypothetical protein